MVERYSKYSSGRSIWVGLVRGKVVRRRSDRSVSYRLYLIPDISNFNVNTSMNFLAVSEINNIVPFIPIGQG